MSTLRPLALFMAAVILAACVPDQADTPNAEATDTTATGATGAIPAAEGVSRVAVIEGFSTPESVIYDAAHDVYFVTNINGNPGAKDNNGFISRVEADGTVDSLKFVAGGRGGVTLHAPKGTAIVGDTLWVADIDAVRGYDTRTGGALAVIEFGDRAVFLNDMTLGPDGALYVTDTDIRIDDQGNMTQAGNGRVFRLAPDRSVTVAVESDTMAAPNGITWDAAGNRFVIGSAAEPTVYAWEQDADSVTPAATALGDTDGIAAMDGRILVSSWSDSSLTAIEAGQPSRLIAGLVSPADFGVDPSRNRVMIPLFTANRVEVWEVGG